MASKQVTDREKASRAVIAAATSHADAIASAVSAGISPHLKKGEPLPAIAPLANLLARRLKSEIDALVEADRAHEAELSDDAAHREARDDAAEYVRTALVDLRDAVSTAYGAQGLLALGLAEAIPVDPSAIASRAKTVRKNLLDDSIKLPKPRRASLKVDRKGFANEIGEDLPALTKALENVAREEREGKATLVAKGAAMTSHDRAFSRTATLLAALASYGDLDELAASVRPSARRSGRAAADDDSSAPEQPSEENASEG
jgi:hypothetical protein